MILMYILLTVYILAVNFYSFLLIKNAREDDEGAESGGNANGGNVGNGKLLLSALLGGAITAYVCMFVFRYRLNNLLLMVAMPVLAALNVYLFFIAYRSGFGIFVV
jgi:uncharacterized membrane protein YsdA (DUF1294 family)